MSALSPHAIAKALGGEVSGRQVLCPGPGHSAGDRSLSITLSADGDPVVHSFAGDDWQTCRGYVRARLGLSPFKPESAPRMTPPRQRNPVETTPPDNREAAKWLWGGRKPITDDCPMGLYLRERRGYHGAVPPTLCYLPANGKHPPAMIAAFGFCDEPEPGMIIPPAIVTGIHLTRLTPSGEKAGDEGNPTKIMLGSSVGLPIVLAPANDLLAIDITEGIETGLSVLAWRGAGVWVAGSAGRMSKLAEALPSYIECVHIFAERDGGFRFAQEAARIVKERGIEIHLQAFGERA